MNRRQILLAGGAGALLSATRALAQQDARKYRIAFLFTASPSAIEPYLAALKERLVVHGFVDGKNLDIDARRALFMPDVLKLLAEQVALKPDAMFALIPYFTPEAMAATRSLPVVFAWVSDPVVAGIVKDYARPGSNATGVSSRFLESARKRLELLGELRPAAKRVAIAGRMFQSDILELTTRLREVARQLGFEPLEVDAATSAGVSAVQEAIRNGAEAMLPLHVYSYHGQQLTGQQIIDLTIKHRIPGLFAEAQMVEAGGLISCGTNPFEDVRRGADMLAKVLRGASPAEIPVDQGSPLELAVNLKTASAVGIRVPPSILARANRVIE